MGVFLGKYNLLSYHLLCLLEYSEFTYGNRPNSLLSDQHITSEVGESSLLLVKSVESKRFSALQAPSVQLRFTATGKVPGCWLAE